MKIGLETRMASFLARGGLPLLLASLMSSGFGQSPDSFNPAASGLVSSSVAQVDGKILVGGSFTTLGGQTCKYIGRLGTDGSLETNFNPGAGFSVYSLALQTDGKVLVGGGFRTLGGQTRNYIGRLNTDGVLDSSFNPGANNAVYCLAVQADRKILVGGSFTTLGGQTCNYIGRLNTDGSLDSSFNPGVGGSLTAYVGSLAVQADGKILLGGFFTTLGGQTRTNIGRLNPDGTLDTTFDPGANLDVYSLVVQADEKILAGGYFTRLGGQTRNYIGRLNPDGTLDTTFNPSANAYVRSLVLQTDGRILVGGNFLTLGGQVRNYIGRLHSDGTLDASFNPGANSEVRSLALQVDGKVLVGGNFTTLGGQTRNRIGRLSNSEPATQDLRYDGSTLSWLRGGASPEVWCTIFEYSTNDVDWTSLGSGGRVTGGWGLPHVSLPTPSLVRARGFAVGGFCNGSSWYVETLLSLSGTPAPVIPANDGHLGFTNGTFGFSVQAQDGQVVAVEGSTNLLSWVALQTNMHGTAPIFFSDPASTNYPSRFYRARLVP